MMTEQQNAQSISWYHPASLIATWFGIGKIPFAPGTFGSLGAFPLFIASHYLLCLGKNESTFNYIYLLFLAILFILGQWASNVYMKKTGKQDPGEIVIDEVMGQLIVLFAAFSALAPLIGLFDILYGSASEHSQKATIGSLHELFSTPAFLVSYIVTILPTCFLGFILFRIFDIWKPFPIGWCDRNIKGGFGVMFDDIFAAVYACIILYASILLFFIYFVPPLEPQAIPTEIVQ
jgi:phosphatidylglycerophosphatase A